MHDPAPRVRHTARLALPAFLLLSASVTAQFNSIGFETVTASPAGTLLTGQDTWTLPTATSNDWKAYTYAGNSLSIPAHPFGALNFVSGSPAGTNLGRAERVVPFAITNNKYTLSVDVCPKYAGAATPANNIGGISLQPSTTNRSLNMIMVWPATPTGATWNADFASWTAANVANPNLVPNPAFQGLATNKWYRWQVDFDMGNNTIQQVRITDIAAGTTASHTPTGWYLFGGANPTIPMPTSIRMFAGGDASNVVAVDNLELRQRSEATPGRSVAAVAVSTVPATGEMYVVDHQANAATKLMLSTALTGERVNCVLMTSGAAGYVGTNNPVTTLPANLYAISISGTTVTETKLNTTATQGPNLSQITRVGSNFYFATQNAANTGGMLQSVPVSGGPVTLISDMTALTGWTGVANCIASVGTKVYVGSFDATTSVASPGCVVEHDTVANTTKVLMPLPPGKTPSGATFVNTALCHAQNSNGLLVVFGIYGDTVTINTATATVVSHTSAVALNGVVAASALFNSFDLDANTGDLICGTRDGRGHRIASNHIAQGVVPGVGSHATPSSNSVAGISHIPVVTLAKDTSYGAGCPGNNGFTLTDVASGLPMAGNSAFQLGAYSGTGGDPVACMIAAGEQSPAIDLGVIGMPSCFMRITAPALTIGGVLSGTAAGAGLVRFPVPLPAALAGVTIYRQWAEVQVTKTNLLGVVVSNARKTEIK